MIGWTTVSTSVDAERLAEAIIDNKLAVCVQIEGPLKSIYSWKGNIEKSEEWRLMVKFMEPKKEALDEWLADNHPYETHEWVAVLSDSVSADYLKWAKNL